MKVIQICCVGGGHGRKELALAALDDLSDELIEQRGVDGKVLDQLIDKMYPTAE